MESVEQTILQQFSWGIFLREFIEKEGGDVDVRVRAEHRQLARLGQEIGFWNVEGDHRMGATEVFDAHGVFQSALLLAAEFDDDYIVYLRRALEENKSCLDDERTSPTIDDLWQSIHSLSIEDTVDDGPTRDTAACIIGFIALTHLLTSFDHLFSLADADEALPENSQAAKISVLHTVASLLRWRLDLFDQRIVKRLNVVADLFWRICREEFDANRNLGIEFAQEYSENRLTKLYANWKSMTDPKLNLRGLLGG